MVGSFRVAAGTAALLGLVVLPLSAQEPAPPPPGEEAITICLVDPTTAGGVGEVNAIFVPGTGDTLVVVNGNRVPLDVAMGDVTVVRETDWFVRGEPLTLMVDDEEVEFVTFGGTRTIEAEDLVLVGTVNGLPVYADRDDIENDLEEELEDLVDADSDFDDLLEENEELQEDFEGIELLYVPAQPTGCVFQPLQRVAVVRGVRG